VASGTRTTALLFERLTKASARVGRSREPASIGKERWHFLHNQLRKYDYLLYQKGMFMRQGCA
jgi:hypothetical protein